MTALVSAGKQIVVTGGAGFVGSSLVGALLDRGCRVIVLDDFSGGDVGHLDVGNPRLSMHAVTVGHPDASAVVSDAVSQSAAVFHLASPIGVHRAHHDRYTVTKSILDAGLMVVEACRTFKCPLLFTSSSEVYGPGGASAITEAAPLVSDLRPRWGYASGKAAIEHVVAGLFLQFDVPAWIVRPFNMTGARQRPETGLVVPTFAEAALRAAPVVVHGDGSQTRAFLHVDDAVDALLLIVECRDLCGRPVNLGGNQPIRIDDLARMVVEKSGRAAPILLRPVEEVFGHAFAIAHDRVPDNTLLATTTGWRSQRSLEQAVSDCVDYLRSRQDHA